MSVEAHKRMPTLFIPHGGGPCFSVIPAPPLPPDLWSDLGQYLLGIADTLENLPKAILIVSGHWETETTTITSGPKNTLYYDYHGFPDHTYHLKYPAKGSPELATRIHSLLAIEGLDSEFDPIRGLDHGVFIPLMLVFPDASIPVIQMSLCLDMDPVKHLRIGSALRPLRDEDVLIVGSGMSYHNMQKMRSPGLGNAESAEFDHWLTETLTAGDTNERDAKLRAWRMASYAEECHPDPEHLLPLLISVGAAGDDIGRKVYSGKILGKTISGFQFG